MENLIKILVVEDEMIIGAKISMQLTNLGYAVAGILPRGEEAVTFVRENEVDIILLDIQLRGNIDGIETASQIKKFNIPVIYLTANADESTFNRAKATGPFAFISKPFKQLDLQRAIELTISRMAPNESSQESNKTVNNEEPVILNDRIFVRSGDKMIKIMIDDIFYIEADRNYSRIFTTNKEHLLATTLKMIEEKLSAHLFVRIHRSYIINLSHVDEVGESHVVIANKSIPLSAGQKDHLLEKIQML